MGKGRTGYRKAGKEKMIEQNIQCQESIHTIEDIRKKKKRCDFRGKILMQMNRFRIEKGR